MCTLEALAKSRFVHPFLYLPVLIVLSGVGCTSTAKSPTSPSALSAQNLALTTSAADGTTTIGGVVSNTSGLPIANVTVEVISPSTEVGKRAISDSQGNYRLTGIKATTFVVRYSHLDYQTLEREYTFQLGTDRLDLDTRLLASTSRGTGTLIGGVVSDTSGRPLIEARIEVISPASEAGNSTTSDSLGGYRLSGIKSVTFVVRYSHREYQLLEREYTFQIGNVRTDLDTRLVPLLPTGQPGPSPTPDSPQTRQTGVTIQIGNGVAESERSEADGMLRFAQNAVSGIYGLRNENIFVAIYRDVDEMVGVYLNYMGLPASQRDRWRDTLTQFPAFSGYRAIWRGIWNGSRWSQKTWVHEYTHTLQWELSRNGAGGRAPRWLEEGHATLIEERVLTQPATEQWRTWLRQAGVNVRLADIEGEQIFSVRNGYLLGAVGCEYLRVQYGDAAMMEFWRQLGNTSWQNAFQSAFGVTPAAFYDAFERFR